MKSVEQSSSNNEFTLAKDSATSSISPILMPRKTLVQMQHYKQKLEQDLIEATARFAGKRRELKGQESSLEEDAQVLEPLRKKITSLEEALHLVNETIAAKLKELQPKNRDEFFNAYREYLAQASNEPKARNIALFFSSLLEVTQQLILADCLSNEALKDNIHCSIAQDGTAKYSFQDSETLLQISSLKLLPGPGQETDISFLDVVSAETVSKKVLCKEDQSKEPKYYIVGEYASALELVILNKDDRSLKYTNPGKESFINNLSQQFEETDYTFQDAIKDKNVNHLLAKYPQQLLKLKSEALIRLNYIDKDGHYGTLLHKAIDPRNGMAKEDFLKLYEKITKQVDPKIWNNYSNLLNDKGQTVFNLARERGIALTNTGQALTQQDLQDTHTQSVHKSVDQAIVRLAKRLDHNLKLGAISGSGDNLDPTKFKDDPTEINFTDPTKQAVLKTKLSEYFDQLKVHIDDLSGRDETGLFNYLAPSLEKFEKEEGVTCKAVQEIRRKLPYIKNMMDDIAQHDRFSRDGSHYPVMANQAINIGLTPKEILALTFYSSQDETSLTNINPSSDGPSTAKFKMLAELSFLEGLYDLRRGYNIDRGDTNPTSPDNNRCLGGSVNSMVNSLNGTHSLVLMVKITETTVKAKICGLVNQFLSEPNKREMLNQESLNLNLMLWQQNNTMPLELTSQINNCFKEEILRETIHEYGSYFGATPDVQLARIELLYQQALAEVRISQELQKGLSSLDITKIPAKQIYSLLSQGKLPRFILSSRKGYVTILDYLHSKDPEIFKEILQLAATENKLMDLLDNKFGNLSCLEQETIIAFLAKFTPQNNKNLAVYVDCDGSTALIWAAAQNNVEAIEAIVKDQDFNPNFLNKKGASALMVAVVNGNVEAIRVLLKCPAIKPDLQTQDGLTALMLAAMKGNAEAIITLVKECPGIDVNRKTKIGNTALMLAAKEGNTEALITLLKECRNIDLNHKNINGDTALILAVDKNHVDAVNILASYKLNPVQWLLTNNVDAEIIIDRLKNNDLRLTYWQKGEVVKLMAKENKPEFILEAIYQDPKNVGYLNNRGVFDAFTKYFSTPTVHEKLAPSEQVNIMAKFRQAYNKSWYSNIDKATLEANEKLAQGLFAEYSSGRYELLGADRIDLNAKTKKLFNQALLEKDITLIKKIIDISKPQDITILFSEDNGFKGRVEQYAKSILNSLEDYKAEEQQERLKHLQYLGGHGNVFSKPIGDLITAKLEALSPKEYSKRELQNSNREITYQPMKAELEKINSTLKTYTKAPLISQDNLGAITKIGKEKPNRLSF